MRPIQLSAALALAAGSTAFAQTAAPQQQYAVTDLVADSTATAKAAVIDPNLIGGWGLSESSAGPWWLSDNGSGLSTLYNGAGARQSLVVTVPSADPKQTPLGTPTGVVFNAIPSNFVLPDGKAGNFFFATLDGTISGWNSGVPASTAQIVASKPGASFTGLAEANATVGGKTGAYLYATDFANRTVSVYDSSFKEAAGIEAALAALALPPGSAPFGIQNVGGNLWVTLAPADGSTGPGLGAVALISPEGKFFGLLQGGRYLNAPWGIALAPGNFGDYSHDLLVGNNGDGKINVFNPQTGAYIATLADATGAPIVIDGLWGLSFGNDTTNGGPATTLYFAAAPGNGGLFGSIKPVANLNGSNN